jgi:SAM-dependent methyltransferase
VLVHRSEPCDPAVAAFLRASGVDPATIDLAIDARDEMLAWAQWAHHGCRQLGLVNYFRSGLSAWRLIRHLLAWRFGAEPPGSVLDFASGFGRVTRFLAAGLPPDRITVAEIDDAAVELQRSRFGVLGVVSPARPEELRLPGTYDCVLAFSLFSHLPEESFGPWLAGLLGTVTPGGLFAFSVHDEAVMLPGRTMPAAGLYFEEVSESASLDRRQYGSSWVTERFVAAALGAASGGRATYKRLPRALWHSQDVYVVAAGSDRSPLADLSPPSEPEGYLDRCAVDRSGNLEVGGWAADRATPGALRVEIDLGGESWVVPVDEERADVEALVGPNGRVSGWRAALGPIAGFPSDAILVVSVIAPGGERTVVHASALEVAALYSSLARDRAALSRQAADLDRATAEHRGVRSALDREHQRARELDRRVHELGWEAHVLQSRLAAMEASRFWRLRRLWFALSRGRGR